MFSVFPLDFSASPALASCRSLSHICHAFAPPQYRLRRSPYCVIVPPMLSRRPSNGLFTYNFELGRLRVTTLDSTASLRLDERDYTSKLVLTLRQFRNAPRKGTKKVESGYLFILHSGTDAIVGPTTRPIQYRSLSNISRRRRGSTSGKFVSPHLTGPRRRTRSEQGVAALSSSIIAAITT